MAAPDKFRVVVEGAVDRFLGRPLLENPYNLEVAPEFHAAWAIAWREADEQLEIRGQQEATRWLSQAA